MLKNLFFPVILLLTVITCCFAADLTGKWVGSVDSADGQIPITYKFTVDGQVLKGTAEAMNQSMAIQNGKVSGDSLFFEVEYNGMPVFHTGTVIGDSLRMQLEIGDDVMNGVFVKQN